MEKAAFASDGALGKVHKGKWGGQDVVIKVIKTSSEEAKLTIKSEAKIAVPLDHPNVLKVFGITTVKGEKLGLVMEWAERGSLAEWIGKVEIGPEKARKIALGIIDGLKYVHSQKVIHRNIKPKNILMFGPEDDMIPKIAEFGVAKVLEKAVTQTKVGEDIYVAPEVKVHSQYSFPADIFSLATTLFEMFNEKLISESSNEMKRFIMAAHSGRFSDFPQTCKVPEYLRKVIEKGWNEKPEERPSLDKFQEIIKGLNSILFLLHMQQRYV